MLEGMILARPVIALDYHNVPRFVPTAWTISASEQIPLVLQDATHPSSAKMEFQGDVLWDCLSWPTPAAPRVARLMLRMVEIAREDPARIRRGQLPTGLLDPPVHTTGAGSVTLKVLYPDNPAFQEDDIARLQVRLARLQKKVDTLEAASKERSFRNTLFAARRGAAAWLRSRSEKRFGRGRKP